MDWLAQNWVWMLVGVAFVAMHLFGHGGHAGSGAPRARVARAQSGPSIGERRDGRLPPRHRH